jgi:hypothetical protein
MLRQLVFVVLLLGSSAGAAKNRIAYTKVGSPADCVAIYTTTASECQVKASKCLSRYDIPMEYFKTGCEGTSPMKGCQCADRCNRKRACTSPS